MDIFSKTTEAKTEFFSQKFRFNYPNNVSLFDNILSTLEKIKKV